MAETGETVRDLIARLGESEWPEPELLREILAEGERAFDPLLEIVERPDVDETGAIYFAAPLLALLGSPRGIEPLTALLRGDDEELMEWLCGLPSPLQALGPEVIPPLLEIACDESLPWYPRAMAAAKAKEIAGDDPDLRAMVAGAFLGALTDHVARAEGRVGEPDDEELDVVGSLVCDLAELAYPEARPLIEAAFAAEIVNEEFIGPKDVEMLYEKGGETKPSPDDPREEWLGWYTRRREEALSEQQRREQRERLREAMDRMPDTAQMPVVLPPKPGRNDPCWCGSGKKYKKCHLVADQQARL